MYMMRWAACFVAILAGQCGSQAEDPFRQMLSSTARNTSVGDREFKSSEITPQSPPWNVRKLRLRGGKQEGVEIVVVDNGRLRFTVVPTRGMGIYRVRQGEIRLGWDSPVKELVHPQFVNLQSRGGLGWLEGFNEWMCRCGLESNGHPGTDEFINNVGDKATMELTLHGKIANVPASEVELIVDREPPYRIRLRGRVDERMFYGPKLELHTEVSTEPGKNSLRITDVIVNQGAAAQEFQILYHANYGRPLLEAGSTLVAPIKQVTPFNAHAARSVKTFDVFSGPQAGFVEQVYCMRLLGQDDGKTLIMLQNQAKDTAVSMAFVLKELPYFTLWKNTAAEKDGYVTGLEPGTNFPFNRRIERRFGRVPKLGPGERYRVTLDVGVHAGKDNVQRLADRIKSIQAGRRTVVDDRPMETGEKR